MHARVSSIKQFLADAFWLVVRRLLFAIFLAYALLRRWLTSRQSGAQDVHTECVMAGPAAQRLVILGMYQTQLCPNLERYIAELTQAGYEVVAVNNARLVEADRLRLAPRVRAYLERSNHGYDFGAYKTGIDWCRRHGILQREITECLVLANDSVLVIPSAMPHFLAQLEQQAGDFVGVFDAYRPRYHLCSWFIRFNRLVLSSEDFFRYWENFIPLVNRPANIMFGEVALTARLCKLGFLPGTVYSTQKLREFMQERSAGKTHAAQAIAVEQLLRDLHENLDEPSGLGQVDGAALNRLLDYVPPILLFGIWAAYEMKQPFLKKDILWRSLDQWWHAEPLLRKLEQTEGLSQDELVRPLLRRGMPSHQGLLTRLLVNAGVI